MNDKIIKKIGIKQDTGKYIYANIGVDADKVEINESMNLAEKIVEIDNKFEDLEVGGYANKDIYGDEKINLGRKTGTTAGPYSVTIGRDVSATGTCSLAEGKDTAAKGNYSHSEGYATTANGDASHAEGDGTIASGDYSHSEGYRTIASGRAQHVQGQYNVEDTNDRYAHIVGGGTKMERKNIHTLDWEGNAEFAGDVQGYDSITGKKVSLLDKATIYGDTTINVGRKENSTVGEYSTAEGYNTTASGGASHSEGTGTTAKGGYSHAEGNSSTAIGDGSHSEGYATTAGGNASHSEGENTIASGRAQHVQGKYNIEDINDRYAHIVGGGTYDERKNIHTLDWYGNAEFAGDVIAHDENGNEVSLISLSGSGGSSDDCASKAIYGDNHVSLGRELGTTVGNNSFAFGYEVEASGEYSHAEGSETTAIGNYSHAEGYGNTAKGDHSHSEGYNTIASEGASHSEGYGTKASGARSHAEGSSTTASGHSSHAEGTNTTANGAYSHAEGENTTASGFASHVEGYYTIAKGNYQHVQGKYNKEDTLKYAHIVGGGTSNSKRKNIHTLDWQGNAEFAGDVVIHDRNGNAISLVDAISLINTALTNANLL